MFGQRHFMSLGLALVISIAGLSGSAFAAGKVFLEKETARWGSTYSVVLANHPNTCQNECAKDKQCMSWTYVLPTKKSGGECQLKNMVPHRSESACCISGVLVGQGALSGDMARAAPNGGVNYSAVAPQPVLEAAPVNALVGVPVEGVVPADLTAPVADVEDDDEEEQAAVAPLPPLQLVPASYKP